MVPQELDAVTTPGLTAGERAQAGSAPSYPISIVSLYRAPTAQTNMILRLEADDDNVLIARMLTRTS